MAAGKESKRQGQLRAVGQNLPRIAGRVLGRQGLGEARLVADWAAVMGAELAASTLPIKLSFPAGERRNGTLRLRVTSGAALAVQHREPQILERINGFFGYPAVARLVLVQGPVPARDEAPSAPKPPLSSAEAENLDRRLLQLPDSTIKSALRRLGAAILRERRG